MSIRSSVSVAALLLAFAASPAFADDATIQKWIDNEFQPSTLSKDDQTKEMQWFAKAAEPFKGMEINVVSETLTDSSSTNRRCSPRPSPRSPASRSSTTSFRKATSSRRSRPRCSPARTSMTAGSTTSDFIGTHPRYKQTVNLTD